MKTHELYDLPFVRQYPLKRTNPWVAGDFTNIQLTDTNYTQTEQKFV